ncbi:MAG: tol-pal system protein YbgF [Gammaproteobacteria bacterium]|nr:tol-pal system protein YbgF [Gammaproteobacteria bacterium]
MIFQIEFFHVKLPVLRKLMSLAIPLVLLTISLPLQAAKKDLYPQVVSLEQRLSKLERVVDNDSLVEMLTRLEQIEMELQLLRSDVETLQYQSQQSNQRQRDLYLDIDSRLQVVESSASAAGAAIVAGAALSAGKLPVPGGSPEENYQAAFELLKQGRYDEALIGFQQFLAAYPENGLRDNAQYWLGETLYVTQKYDEAIKAFQLVINEYPSSRKIPDALLKLGFSNYELKNYSQARKGLNAVLNGYPESTAAKLATERLTKMTAEGV